jgi:hypothetical protein
MFLVQWGTNGPSLPVFKFGEGLWYSEVGEVSARLTQSLGFATWGLRQLFFGKSEKQSAAEGDAPSVQWSAFELEILDIDQQLGMDTVAERPELGWLAVERVAELVDLPEALAAALQPFARELSAGIVPSGRPPWARAGWLGEARAWVCLQLKPLGLELKAIEQVKQWGISTVLKLKTSGPNIYFKGTGASALFVNEGQISARLHTFFPDRIPKPLALLPDKNWMLLPDFGDNQSMDLTLEALQETLAVQIDLQRRSEQQIDALLSAGCIDRRIEVVKTQIDPLLQDPEAVDKLTSEQRERLWELRPLMHDLLDQLAGCGIPDTLGHGDLEPHNTARPDGRLIVFDWTDACITHPFLDQLMVGSRQKQDGFYLPLKQQLLEGWLDVLPLHELEAAWNIARVMFRLHVAVSYQHIVMVLEPASKVELNVTSYLLRDLLTDLELIAADRA